MANDSPLQPTLGELVSGLAAQLSRLVRDEIALLQAELAEKGKRLGLGIGLFVGAALFGFFAFATLIAAAVLGLAEALPAWLAALLVAVGLLLVAGILAFVGKRQVDKGTPPVPDVKGSIEQDVAAVKTGLKEGLER